MSPSSQVAEPEFDGQLVWWQALWTFHYTSDTERCLKPHQHMLLFHRENEFLQDHERLEDTKGGLDR